MKKTKKWLETITSDQRAMKPIKEGSLMTRIIIQCFFGVIFLTMFYGQYFNETVI